MFLVTTVDGVDTKVSFKYGTDVLIMTNKKTEMGYDVHTTTCTVGLYKGKEKIGELGTATVICSPLDKFSKITGRKLALTKVLKNMKLDKAGRTMFWDAYLKNCNK